MSWLLKLKINMGMSNYKLTDEQKIIDSQEEDLETLKKQNENIVPRRLQRSQSWSI
jgi:hypothetical protein